MKIINLTPESIVLELSDWTHVPIPASGIVASCEIARTPGYLLESEYGEIRIEASRGWTEIKNLPEQEEGILYFVDPFVFLAGSELGRKDLVMGEVVGGAIRELRKSN